MTFARKESLGDISFPGLDTTISDILSDGFKSSTLPASQTTHQPEKKSENLYELVQKDGTNVRI